ncbi:MAG: hypothetical protein ACWGOV_02265 [Acidiferrobacterales bacterium]
MIKPVLSSILMASVLLAGIGQAQASDRDQSYRDRGTEYHQHERGMREHQIYRKFERREFERRERYPRYAYRYRDVRPYWRHRHPAPRLERRWHHRYHPRPVVVVHDRYLMGPVVAGAILGAIIANNQAR